MVDRLNLGSEWGRKKSFKNKDVTIGFLTAYLILNLLIVGFKPGD